MCRRARTVLAAALLMAVPIPSQAALAPYVENFETLAAGDASALGNAGWIVFGNVYSPDHLQYYYGYGPFPAPNDTAAFCEIVSGEGGLLQGAQQLSAFNDYKNADHALGRLIESNVYREQTIGAGDVGTTWTFEFDAKLGNLERPSTAYAFIKTLDPRIAVAGGAAPAGTSSTSPSTMPPGSPTPRCWPTSRATPPPPSSTEPWLGSPGSGSVCVA